MSKITVYKCPFTKKVFETRSGYRRHLLTLRAKRNLNRRVSAKRRDARRTAEEELAKVRSFRDLEKAMRRQFANMMVAYCGSTAKKIEIMRKFRMTRVSFRPEDRNGRILLMKYSDRVSNTHYCPKNGVTNWHCLEGAPTGYPGFRGSVEFTIYKPANFDGWFADYNDALKSFGINVGTGGGHGETKSGGERYRFQALIFLDDFPALEERVEEIHESHRKLIFSKKLRGEHVGSPMYDEIVA